MDDKRKVSIDKQRHVVTYAELWHTSWSLLKQGGVSNSPDWYHFFSVMDTGL